MKGKNGIGRTGVKRNYKGVFGSSILCFFQLSRHFQIRVVLETLPSWVEPDMSREKLGSLAKRDNKSQLEKRLSTVQFTDGCTVI